MSTNLKLKLSRRTLVGVIIDGVTDSAVAIGVSFTGIRRPTPPGVTVSAARDRTRPCAAFAAGITALVPFLMPSTAEAQDTVMQLPPVLYTAIDGHTETFIPGVRTARSPPTPS